MNGTTIVRIILGIMSVYIVIIFGRDLTVNRKKINDGNWIVTGIIGFITNFFDTLGIGSYAPTTMFLKLTHSLKNDKLLPGTLTVACSIPVLVEAFLYTGTVKVESTTLLVMVIAAILGSWLGSKVVAKLDEKKIQVVMGIALAVTAILMVLSATGVTAALGAGNTAMGIHGWKLCVAAIVNFILGALMTAGIGLYAPCLALVYLMGMNPLVTFPIMMASCASLMPVAAYTFIKNNDYARVPSVAITIGGSIGVYVAYTFVKSMNVKMLTWLVIIVMVYTSILMLVEGIKKFKAEKKA